MCIIQHAPPQPPDKRKKHGHKSGGGSPTTPNVAQLSPKNSTTSPANNGEFMFSFENYSDNHKHTHTFKLSTSTTTPTTKQRVNNTGIGKDNPIHVYLQNKDKYKYNTSSLHNKSLNSSIRDGYFDDKHSEDSNDMISAISIKHSDIELPRHKMDNSQSPSSLLRRGRSKSMGSFAETMEKAMRDGDEDEHEMGADDMNDNLNVNVSANVNVKHSMTRSELMDIEQLHHNHISSPIYKELAEMSKKLTITSFGPSRRPTHGHIHCVLKVECHDFKGQCCIPFKWSDFGKQVEDTQYADLCYHGIPLYDKTGSPIKCKIRYKVSLMDKQIVFDNH